MSGGYPVVARSEAEGVGVPREITNPTTTRKKELFPGGLTKAEISYLDLGAAAGKWIFVVFDALSDDDADTKLTDDETRYRVMIGKEGADAHPFQFTDSTPVTRIDVVSDAATETGASVVRIEGIGPTL